MINIGVIFDNSPSPNEYTATYSLSGHLEAIVGGYCVQGECNDKFIRVYYNPKFDIEKDYFFDFITQENLIAYVSLEHHYALVIETISEKFKKDTETYGLSYFSFETFDTKLYYYTSGSNLPYVFKNIIWIDDSFLNDKKIKFDFKTFEYIDTGSKYLNPNRFSINQLMNYLYAPWRL